MASRNFAAEIAENLMGSPADEALDETRDSGASRRASLRLPPELEARTRFLESADRSVVESIQCGILFVMAFWSVYALKAFAELKRVLGSLDPAGLLELVVVDADGCGTIEEMGFRADAPAGVGESAWVWKGRIVHTSGFGYDPECFEPNTRGLLRLSADE